MNLASIRLLAIRSLVLTTVLLLAVPAGAHHTSRAASSHVVSNTLHGFEPWVVILAVIALGAAAVHSWMHGRR